MDSRLTLNFAGSARAPERVVMQKGSTIMSGVSSTVYLVVAALAVGTYGPAAVTADDPKARYAAVPAEVSLERQPVP